MYPQVIQGLSLARDNLPADIRDPPRIVEAIAEAEARKSKATRQVSIKVKKLAAKPRAVARGKRTNHIFDMGSGYRLYNYCF